MDEVMKALRVAMLFSVLAALTQSTVAKAQAVFIDPTRPPPEALLAPGEVVATPVSTLPSLQSVLISDRPGGRRVAVIDGQTVRLGAKFRDAVLIRVSASEVALRRGKTIEVLKLAAETPAEPVDAPIKMPLK